MGSVSGPVRRRRWGLVIVLLALTAASSCSSGQPDTSAATSTSARADSKRASTTAEVTATTAKPAPTPDINKQTQSAIVSKEMFGDKWPLSVPEGLVQCVRGTQAVTFRAPDASRPGNNSITYAVNGRAKTLGKDPGLGWQPLEAIWLPNPSIPGARIDISPILDLGLSLCK